MIYFGYPLDIYGWKPKSKIEFRAPNPKTMGKIILKPESRQPKSADMRPETALLPWIFGASC